MPAPLSDRNLLFAVLALQNDLVGRDDLLAGMHAWALAKQRALGELLVERGAMQPEHRAVLDALIDAQVQRHGSVEHSLRALDVSSSARQALAGVADEDVQASLSATVDRTTDHRPAAAGATLRYRVLRPHARGGLGEVFVAEDLELHREIALKEIQHEHANHAGSRGRFVLEAEITGGLEHPGIVPVYGLGHYDDGRPFYAMRFVKGDNLKSAIERFHASKGRFDTVEFRQLLGRFVDVCQAVAYAHSRGVLHRDLKPGNVMLGKFGETLLVDWGLAKVVGRAGSRERPEDGDEMTLRPSSGSGVAETVAGSAIGTPSYMSPEQAAGRIDQLGPATDIYSLGATLYALLTNHAPVEGGDIGEKLQKVQRGEWRRPRQVNPSVPAALEAVCVKAMAMKPGDRYQTALSVAEDLEHWLADEPVSAYREPALVQARRWARKHPGTVAALAATVLVGLLGVGTGAIVLGHKNRQLEEAKERAEARLDQMEKANEILGSIFVDLDPDEEKKEGKPLREILGARLDKATAALDGEAIGDPLTMATMQNRLGLSHLGLGYPGKALILFEKAVETRKAELGEDHSDTLDSRNNLALAHFHAGEVGLAISMFERTLKARETTLGENHTVTLQSRHNLASAHLHAGKVGLAISMFERTIKASEAKLGDDHPATLNSRNSLGLAYKAAGKLDLAIPLLERTLKDQESKLGENHPNTLLSRNNLALAYKDAGKLDLAIPLLERTLKTREAKLGDDHPLVLASRNNLALAYATAGKLDLAIPLLERTLKAREAKLGDDHPHTLNTRNNLASAYWRNKQLDRSVPLFEDLLRQRRAKLGDEHPDTFQVAFNLGVNYRDAGRLKEAISVFDEWLPRAAARLQPGHPPLPIGKLLASATYMRAGQYDKAVSLLGEAVATFRKQAKPGESLLADALSQLAEVRLKVGKPAEAEPLLRECLALAEKNDREGWKTVAAKSLLGEALAGQKKHADAEPLLLAGYQGLKVRQDKIPPLVRAERLEEALTRLVQHYEAIGKKDDAAKWRQEIAALKASDKKAKP